MNADVPCDKSYGYQEENREMQESSDHIIQEIDQKEESKRNKTTSLLEMEEEISPWMEN